MPGNDDIAAGPRAGPAGLGLGERLRSARKARALSVEQVADGLRLEVPTVLALEEGRFATLGAPVFVRGHLKRYATLVGLPVDVVLEAYRETEPDSVNPPALTRPREPEEKVNLRPWGLWVLLPVCILIVIVWMLGGNKEQAPASNMVVTETPAETPASAPAREPATAAPSTPSVPSVPEALPVAAPKAVPEAAPEVAVPPSPPVAAGTKGTAVVLAFRDDSWVNVSDADRRLLYGLQRKGSRQEVRGRPPFRVMIGNAKAVTVAVEGQVFTVPESAVTDNVARFDIPAPQGVAPGVAPRVRP